MLKFNTVRLVSEKAVSQMLHISPEALEALCTAGKLTKYQTSNSLTQYDFNQIIEYRKSTIGAVASTAPAKPKPPSPSAGPRPPAPPPAGGTRLPLSFFSDDDYVRFARELITEKKMEQELRSEKYRYISPAIYEYFMQTPLHCKAGSSETYSLYKPSGETLPPEKTSTPGLRLYVLTTDWPSALEELRGGMIARIRKLIDLDDYDQARKLTVSFLDHILFEHDEKSIQGLDEVVEVLFLASTRRKEMVLNLVPLLESNLTLGLHSARIMALALKFCIKNNYSMKDSKLLCTSALLHDLGKTMLPEHLINCNPYKLSSEEDLRVYRLHSQIGYDLLEDCGIKDKVLNYGALEHHERIDGSGFPGGKRKISFLGQIIGIFDAYDSLRNGRNPSGSSLTSLEALKVMKKECDAGVYSKELFETFVYSLV